MNNIGRVINIINTDVKLIKITLAISEILIYDGFKWKGNSDNYGVSNY